MQQGPGPRPIRGGALTIEAQRFQVPRRRTANRIPAEVVWAWVPFEEDLSQGKDRPLAIIGSCRRTSRRILCSFCPGTVRTRDDWMLSDPASGTQRTAVVGQHRARCTSPMKRCAARGRQPLARAVRRGGGDAGRNCRSRTWVPTSRRIDQACIRTSLRIDSHLVEVYLVTRSRQRDLDDKVSAVVPARQYSPASNRAFDRIPAADVPVVGVEGSLWWSFLPGTVK